MSKRRRRKDRDHSWLGFIGDALEFVFEIGWAVIKIPFKIIAHMFD